MKKGVYYVGDPCYVLGSDHKRWMRLLKESRYFNGFDPDSEEELRVRFWEGLFEDHNMAGGSTAFGDGTYVDNYGNSYPVDSGIIGIVPIELCDNIDMDNMKHIHDGGMVINFGKDFNIMMDGKGKFTFGHIEIDTTNEENYESYY